jgi:hypothetical protein
MQRGLDFLRAQVNHTAVQHQTFLDMLTEHWQDAKDERYRALCGRHLAPMQQHQAMLEQFQLVLGTETSASTRAMARAAGFVRDLADRARDDDYQKLVADIVVSRACQDAFWTFRTAGMHLGDARLERLGDGCEHGHDAYSMDARQLLAIWFVEHARGVPRGGIVQSDRQVTVHPAQLADTDTMPIPTRADATQGDAGPMGPCGPGASYGSLEEQNRDVARDT